MSEKLFPQITFSTINIIYPQNSKGEESLGLTIVIKFVHVRNYSTEVFDEMKVFDLRQKLMSKVFGLFFSLFFVVIITRVEGNMRSNEILLNYLANTLRPTIRLKCLSMVIC